MRLCKLWMSCVLAMVFGVGCVLAADVSLESLLGEMADRTAITEFPSPAYTCQQFSSYDRAAKSETENWFANGDTAQFLRDEMNGDRKEWVLMDTAGPGAIVRWWITAPKYESGAVFRIYIDGNATPAIEMPFEKLIGGDALVGPPLSAVMANGRNLYLPIPYAKSCKVTVDNMPQQGNLYYQINYRTYPAGTSVESFTMDIFKSQQGKIADVQKLLSDPNPPVANATRTEKKGEVGTLTIDFGSESRGIRNRNNPLLSRRANADGATGGAVAAINIKFDAPNEGLAQTLRSTILEIAFDGETTVFCPVGEFFGSGVGVNPYKSWYCTVEKDGTLRSRWVMPYQRGGKLTLRNHDGTKVAATVTLDTIPLPWNDSRMYFHCNWRQEREIESVAGNGTKDWNYISLAGRGVFVGDVLSILNRDHAWWGEGDEKIYFDGQKFPSHFGTGTEDYYGYAWCTPAFFESPFHAQPRAEGPQNYGHATNLRVRVLDGIPFTKNFRFDMEVWHWAATKIDYAVATFWYGAPQATAVHAPNHDKVTIEAKAPVAYNTPGFIPKVKGFEIASVTGGHLSHQDLKNFGVNKWRDDDQLWWTGTNNGDKLALNVKLPKDGKQKLVVQCTKARDYGVAQFWLNGKKVGEPIDFYNDGVIPTGEIVVGEVDAKAGDYTLEVEIVGKNEKSVGTMFGLDWFEFR
ncbi:MAG: glycoside hydrolase family 172 protein [Thermoguttaceae bacterium]